MKFALLAVMISLCAACGEWTPPSPTGPSVPGAIADTPASGATVTGLVKTKGINAMTAASTGAAASLQITVTVAGTNISAPVDGSGRFVLKNVSVGSVTLRFSGSGIDATLPMGSVGDREVVELSLELEARFVRVEGSMRIRSDDSTEVEGNITRVSGACPNLTVVVGGWTLKLTASTQGACGDVRIGVRIKIRGTRSGDAIIVVRVDIEGATGSHEGDEDDDRDR